MLRKLKRTPIFAPVEDTDLWEPCLQSDPKAKTKPFNEWPASKLVQGRITLADLKRELRKLTPSTTDGEVNKYKECPSTAWRWTFDKQV